MQRTIQLEIGGQYRNSYGNTETIVSIDEATGLRKANSGRTFRADGRHAPGGVPNEHPGPSDLILTVAAPVKAPQPRPATPKPTESLIRKAPIHRFVLEAAKALGVPAAMSKAFIPAVEEHLATWIVGQVLQQRQMPKSMKKART